MSIYRHRERQWFMSFLFNPDAVSLTPGAVTATLEASGFTDATVGT
jgi:hypothetical protein